MLIRTHIGVSLDGFIATPDGRPAWDAISTFGPGTHGYDEFTQQCGAVVMGRTNFDQGFEDWLAGGWPWPDKQVYVLTSRSLPEKASAMGIIASQGGPAPDATARSSPCVSRRRGRARLSKGLKFSVNTERTRK